jgi:hypothetical protein
MISALAMIEDPAEYDFDLPDSRSQLESWWKTNGYSNFVLLDNGTVAPEVKKGSIKSHIDEPYTDSILYGPLTVSLGICGEADFYAEKPAKSTHKADTTYSKRKTDIWARYVDEQKSAGILPRTCVRQNAGDAVLFMNHPRQTWHGVAAKTGRVALLYDSCIERV